MKITKEERAILQRIGKATGAAGGKAAAANMTPRQRTARAKKAAAARSAKAKGKA